MTNQIMCSATDDEILTDACSTLDTRGCLFERTGRRRTVCCCVDNVTGKREKNSAPRRGETWGGGDPFFFVWISTSEGTGRFLCYLTYSSNRVRNSSEDWPPRGAVRTCCFHLSFCLVSLRAVSAHTAAGFISCGQKSTVICFENIVCWVIFTLRVFLFLFYIYLYLFFIPLYICITVQIQYSTVYEVEFLWTL